MSALKQCGFSHHRPGQTQIQGWSPHCGGLSARIPGLWGLPRGAAALRGQPGGSVPCLRTLLSPGTHTSQSRPAQPWVRVESGLSQGDSAQATRLPVRPCALSAFEDAAFSSARTQLLRQTALHRVSTRGPRHMCATSSVFWWWRWWHWACFWGPRGLPSLREGAPSSLRLQCPRGSAPVSLPSRWFVLLDFVSRPWALSFQSDFMVTRCKHFQ